MRHTLPAVTAAVLLALAACSSGTAAPGPAAVPTAAVPDSPPVRWINDVCGSLVPLGPATAAVPRVDRNNAAATLQGLSGFFSMLVDAFDQATTRLKAVGPSPIAGGDEIVTRLSTALSASRRTVADARTAIDKVDAGDPAALAAELPAALAPLQQLSTLPNPTAAASPELDSAAAQAPNCRTFSTAASPTPKPGG